MRSHFCLPDLFDRAQPCRAFRQSQLSAKVLGAYVVEDWLARFIVLTGCCLFHACFYTCQANVYLCLSQSSPPISKAACASKHRHTHTSLQHAPVANIVPRAAGELPGHDPKLQKMPPGRKMKSLALFFFKENSSE